MTLYIRISDTDISFARFENGVQPTFLFETYHMRPQVSLTVNLREAMRAVNLLHEPSDRVEVLASGMVTPVPLAEFQEEDAEAAYDYCFTKGEQRRVFYDTVPASNTVLLFALPEATCRTLEDAFGEVRFAASLTGVVRHFASKGLGTTMGKRLFVYPHDSVADVAVFEESRLVMLNTYSVRTLTDVSYYTLNLARHLCLDLRETPFFVAGAPLLRDPAVRELQQYAARVYPITPSAEFNRHIVATTPDVPYDLVCGLLR